MARAKERVLMAWSGGKDSAMALDELHRDQEYEVAALVTAVCGDDGRVTQHGVRRELVEAQARALGLPLEIVQLPHGCDNHTYIERLNDAVGQYQGSGIHKVAFGDLYLDDIRDFREESLEAIGMEAIFPLWHRDTKELSYAFIQRKFKAVVTCVDGDSLGTDYLGRLFDRTFLADLPLAVDPCGENGEFHTFVYDGPLFAQPLVVKLGERFADARFQYCDVVMRGLKEHSMRVKSRA